jgi:hypothetical protein
MTDPAPPKKTPRWRKVLATILVVVGCLLVPISISALWVRNTLLDTDNYVATVGPLASNPDVQQALADDVTNAIFKQVNVDQKIADALPPKGSFLAGPIEGAMKTFTNQAALRLFSSDRFQTVWENANRRAHQRVVWVLTGGGPAVSTKDGAIAINTDQIFDNVKQRLDARGITVFDDVQPKHSQFVLFQWSGLEKAQGGVDLLQKLAWVIPIVAIACLVGGVLLSSRRRRMIERAAIGVALIVGVQLAALKAGRNIYLEAVSGKTLPKGAAGAVWDQIVIFLRTSALTVLVIALIVAIAAWLAGPGKGAVAIRSLWRRALTGNPDPDHPHAASGPVASFVAGSKNGLRVVGAALALLVLIAWNHPTVITVIVVAIVFIVYLAVIEFVGRGVQVDQTTDA